MRRCNCLAKETMQAVSQAEEKAQLTVRQAKEDADRLRQEVAAQGKQLIAEAVENARRQGQSLLEEAAARGEAAKAAVLEETRQEQKQLQAQAEARQGQVAREAERIILGHPRRR